MLFSQNSGQCKGEWTSDCSDDSFLSILIDAIASGDSSSDGSVFFHGLRNQLNLIRLNLSLITDDLRTESDWKRLFGGYRDLEQLIESSHDVIRRNHDLDVRADHSDSLIDLISDWMEHPELSSLSLLIEEMETSVLILNDWDRWATLWGLWIRWRLEKRSILLHQATPIGIHLSIRDSTNHLCLKWSEPSDGGTCPWLRNRELPGNLIIARIGRFLQELGGRLLIHSGTNAEIAFEFPTRSF